MRDKPVGGFYFNQIYEIVAADGSRHTIRHISKRDALESWHKKTGLPKEGAVIRRSYKVDPGRGSEAVRQLNNDLAQSLKELEQDG